MKLVEHYNDAFRQLINEERTSYYPNPSLLRFLKEEALPRFPFTDGDQIEVLEIGCGHGSLFQALEIPNWKIKGLDFSPVAIELATQRNQQANISFEVGDIVNPLEGQSYDLIVDSHCLHCLGTPGDWDKGLQNIFHGLRPGGAFVWESMVSARNMQFDEGLSYNQDQSCLYQGELAIRRVLSAREIEDALLECGFRINYLRVYENQKMIPHYKRQEALPYDPDSMQILCFRPSDC